MAKKSIWPWVIAAVVLMATGVIQLGGLDFSNLFAAKQQAVISEGRCEIDDTTLNLATVSYVNGTSVSRELNHTIFNNQDGIESAEMTVDAYPDQISTTLPSTFRGYAVTGNDDGTDADYYYKKTTLSWDCAGVYSNPSKIRVAEESSITFTGYDDGTSESTWNITVGTSKVTSAELKIASSSDDCIGNPEFSRPILICVNGSASTLAKFNEIKPTGVAKSTYVPGVLSDETSVLGCYVLPTGAVCDGGEYRFYWTIDPVSDPGVSDQVSVIVFDKSYYKDDGEVFREGWEDVSAYASNADIGIAHTSSIKHLYFA